MNTFPFLIKVSMLHQWQGWSRISRFYIQRSLLCWNEQLIYINVKYIYVYVMVNIYDAN